MVQRRSYQTKRESVSSSLTSVLCSEKAVCLLLVLYRGGVVLFNQCAK